MTRFATLQHAAPRTLDFLIALALCFFLA